MANYDRQFARARARKEYKKFIKENPQYKAVTFKEYFKLTKAGQIKSAEQTKKKAEEESHVAAQHLEELDDMFLEDIEEDERTEDSVPE